jgi:hypothetical protein
MITISYITPEIQTEIEGQYYSECAIFACMQDDVTQEYYLPRFVIDQITEAEYIWFKFLPIVDLPEHEQYKFKPYAI